MADTVATATPARTGNKPRSSQSGRKWLIIASFLLPALVVLGALVVYPIVFTAIRSLYDRSGDEFVGWQNYVTMFTNDTTFTAIKNNVLWVLVAPAACTILGLIFAVLLEKLRWKAAFRLIIFMPMAISMLAAGVIFRSMFQENPQLGTVNAALVAVDSVFSDAANYPGANPRPDVGIAAEGGIIASESEVAAGEQQNFPLVAIRQDDVPESAVQAAPAPDVGEDALSGTVWLDVVPGGGGTNGEISEGKRGLPGIRVDAVAADGSIAGSATTEDDGTYVIEGLDPGQPYRVALPASNFGEGFQGVSWLSSTFINAVVILSYIWIWAGFAMVMIASGLSAMDRSLQEAARMDGANEWRVFTRITAPLLAPVLLVVFVTLIINVLKIFDLVYVIPPGTSKPAANVIAVEMWTQSFGGGNDYGLGSALAILLLILVLPSMILNIRRFREERRS
ncbi:ABC transporter permease subunit [Tessaracoccus oleiagri]|uniref:Alpha-glucoside transport system permease protein n=1 Tax=Tessaracoccus oleiagri TaxID=686624 RepID=A0A1G9KT10_9ACTN|nr:ABC transporter permease subunit [Tessaracoccus oleiagri]SDL52888.1 alpha-glucoside transport system permease protein [Tessaracoccus oleiagri]